MTDEEKAQAVLDGLAPSRRWVYVEPTDDLFQHRQVVISELEIERDYYPGWRKQMVAKFGCDHAYIDLEHCIADWITAHWAWRRPDD